MQTLSSDSRSTSIVSGARASLTLLVLINLFNYIDRYVLAAVEPRIAKTFFGDNDPNTLAMTGSLGTAFIVSYLIAAPLFGWLADRMSRWLLVGVGVLLWSLASGGSGLAPTFALLFITRLFVGIGEAGYGPAAPTIISDLYPLERRGAMLARFYMAIPVGSALGYFWGGIFEAWLGWRWAFYLVVPPGILLGILALRRRDHRPVDPGAAAVRRKPRLGDYVSLLTNKSYLLACAGMTAMTFAIGGVSFWMPHYLAVYRNAGSLAHVSTVFGLVSAVAGLSATFLGGIAGDALRRYAGGAYFIVSAMGILLSCPLVLLMLWTPFPWAWIVIFGAVFFLFFNTGPSNTILANVTHPDVRASAFALNIFLIHFFGDAVSPPLLGRIVGHDQRWNLAFVIVTAVMAIAGLLWLWGARYLRADTARALADS